VGVVCVSCRHVHASNAVRVCPIVQRKRSRSRCCGCPDKHHTADRLEYVLAAFCDVFPVQSSAIRERNAPKWNRHGRATSEPRQATVSMRRSRVKVCQIQISNWLSGNEAAPGRTVQKQVCNTRETVSECCVIKGCSPPAIPQHSSTPCSGWHIRHGLALCFPRESCISTAKQTSLPGTQEQEAAGRARVLIAKTFWLIETETHCSKMGPHIPPW
jgi:hypothetical protein